MECQYCHKEKLSSEYPPMPLTSECDHPTLICLRCTISHVEKNRSCPEKGCIVKVSPDIPRLKHFKAILAEMFTEYTATYTPDVALPGQESLHVTMLTGERISVNYSPSFKILDLKKIINKRLKHEISKQKLLYQEGSDDKGIELQVYKDSGKLATLSDYSVKPNSTMHLVVMLYGIPQSFDHVVFDLFWRYPVSGVDYLDASCLAFSGTTFVDLCDWSHLFRLDSSLHHSGDVMDHRNKIGHHTIHVYLKKIPVNITHLFFTLSAWNSPNISRYRNPSLQFYEASDPSKNLCKTTFTHANRSQAVIMCSVSKGEDGIWQIFESGKQSAGNTKMYKPLKSTIRSLINQGF